MNFKKRLITGLIITLLLFTGVYADTILNAVAFTFGNPTQQGLIFSSPLNTGWLQDSTTVSDRTPNGNHGAVTGATISETDTDFSGSGQYINILDEDIFSFGDSVTDTPFSISAWVKMDSANKFRIMGKANEYLFATDGSNKMRLTVLDNGNTDRMDVISSSNISTGVWQQIVGTYDGSSVNTGLKLYIDGELISVTRSTVNYTAMHALTGDVRIGRDGTTYANGRMKNVRMYHKELTATEVKQLFNGVGGDVFNPIQQGLIGLWNLTTGWLQDSTTVSDRTPNGNHGVVTGATVGADFTTFDGVGDYIVVPDSADFSFGNGVTDSPFSISSWITLTETTNEIIVAKYDAGAGYSEYFLRILGGKLALVLYSQDGNTPHINVLGTTILSTGQSYNVVSTYDGSGSIGGITLYVNSVAESMTDNSIGTYIAMSNTPSTIKIGTIGSGLGEFSGDMKNTRIYNRELSSTDIKLLFDSNK